MRIFDLTGRVAIVTGGNRGIGLGIAEGLAQAGAKVMIAARDLALSEQVAARLREGGADAAFCITDIGAPESCAAMAEATLQAFGRLDILVNNAGIMIGGAPETTALADWERVLAINLTGAFLCAQAVFPAMQRQGGGKIINLGSLASIFGTARGAAYAASKGGIVQLTKSLAVSWGPENIQVNAILPGYIESELTLRAEAEKPGSFAAKLARTPAGRIGTPQDIAGAAIFLAGAASDYITGVSIPIDGGYGVQI
jgi:2-deoxy-D-gluconate 3-dehydrogenase